MENFQPIVFWKLQFGITAMLFFKIFIYLFGGQSKIEQERNSEKRTFHLQVYSPYTCNSQGWASLKSRAKNSTLISHMSGRGASTGAISYCLLTYSSRKIALKSISGIATFSLIQDAGIANGSLTHCNTLSGVTIWNTMSIVSWHSSRKKPIWYSALGKFWGEFIQCLIYWGRDATKMSLGIDDLVWYFSHFNVPHTRLPRESY